MKTRSLKRGQNGRVDDENLCSIDRLAYVMQHVYSSGFVSYVCSLNNIMVDPLVQLPIQLFCEFFIRPSEFDKCRITPLSDE